MTNRVNNPKQNTKHEMNTNVNLINRTKYQTEEQVTIYNYLSLRHCYHYPITSSSSMTDIKQNTSSLATTTSSSYSTTSTSTSTSSSSSSSSSTFIGLNRHIKPIVSAKHPTNTYANSPPFSPSSFRLRTGNCLALQEDPFLSEYERA